MKFPNIISKISYSAKKNAPGLLTAAGIVTLAGAVISTVPATVKAVKVVEDAKNEKFDALPDKEQEEMIIDGTEVTLTPIEYVKACWKLYLVPLSLAGGSCACFILSHKILFGRQAAALAAYQFTRKALENYQKQTMEDVGERKEREIRQNSMQKGVNFDNFDERYVINTGHGNYLMVDYLTGKFFRSDIEYVRKVENKLNKRLRHEFWISGNDYYYEMGMPPCGFGKDLGWRLEDGEIEFEFSYGPGPKGNGESCCIVSPGLGPWPKYRFGDLDLHG